MNLVFARTGATLLFTSSALAQGIRPLPIRIDPRASLAAKRLETATIYDSSYRRPRRIWIYTPPGYDARATTPYPLIIAFDGAEYQDTMPLPFVLDTLLVTHQAPAFVAVLIDNGGGIERIADLGNAERMVTFISKQLLPHVRARYRVTTDPHRVIATGSSAGGLASSFLALRRPDLVGNVLSQSGAFWRGPEASNDAPYEWLTSQAKAMPKRDVRFFMDVGELEDHATLGGSGPNFRDATRRFRDALRAKGYDVLYAEIPEGQHGPPYWATRLPVGIAALASGW